MKRVNLKKLVFLAIILISIPVFSQNAKKFYKTGLEFVAAENFTDAIDQFTKALELNPDYSLAFH